jgi:acyl-CoA synthetase (AMP-forming)/AMP-acid ligase II
MGRGVDAGELDRVAAAVRPEDVATIAYASGTTGPPKGCVISHANLIQTAAMYERQIALGPGSVVFMFLPLAHLLARVTQIVVLDVGGTIAYWRGESKGPLEDLRDVHPTHLPTVPRALEKIHLGALSDAEQSGRLGQAVFRWALGSGRRVRTLERRGSSPQISPDGQLVAYSCHLGLMLISATGGHPRLLVRGVVRSSGRPTADGSRPSGRRGRRAPSRGRGRSSPSTCRAAACTDRAGGRAVWNELLARWTPAGLHPDDLLQPATV